MTQTGGSGSVTIQLTSGVLGTSAITVKRLTYDEIIAAGIDPSDPSNQNVIEFTIHLCFSDTGSCTDLGGYMNDGASGSGFIGVEPGGGGGGGSCDSDSCELVFGEGTEDETIVIGTPEFIGGQPHIFWMIIPGKARFLKEFFDVGLAVTNFAETQFTFENGNATLQLPDGLISCAYGPGAVTERRHAGHTWGADRRAIRSRLTGSSGATRPASTRSRPPTRARSHRSTSRSCSPPKTRTRSRSGARTPSRSSRTWMTRRSGPTPTAADRPQERDRQQTRRTPPTSTTPRSSCSRRERRTSSTRRSSSSSSAPPRSQPGETWYTPYYVLVSQDTGILDLNASYIKRTAGAEEGAPEDQLIEHPAIQTPATSPAIQLSGETLSWRPSRAPTATRCSVCPPAPAPTLPDRALRLGADRTTTGTSVPITGGGGGYWYAVSTVTGGENELFHPIVEGISTGGATAEVDGSTLRYTGSPGATNNATISLSSGTYSITDPGESPPAQAVRLSPRTT